MNSNLIGSDDVCKVVEQYNAEMVAKSAIQRRAVYHVPGFIVPI